MILVAAAAVFLLSHAQEIEQWRQERDARLRAEDGWLSLMALEWLEPGPNRFNSFPGVFTLRGSQVTHAFPEQPERPLIPDKDKLASGSRTAVIIVRGGRHAVRVRDRNAPTRTQFRGLEYFPVDESWRVRARWVDDAREVRISTVLGGTEAMRSPGYVVFQRNGKNYRLRPVYETPGTRELFFIFRDTTSRKETYPAGRFLYASPPRDGTVILDFNKAYNPPCAFTPYSTCPLPPKENQLPIRVEAGELRYRQ